ncbi:stefin-C-like [Hemiscyllium ocellatum]|uniref:stefin-C-like n=1 Tax=Hemiscyllium ocellatum TaxID=170820 RepID=UPI002965D498|nr:stefin-C-like [Hemiscyllium ocellatum]
MDPGQHVMGGYGTVQAVSEEIQDLAQKFKPQVESKLNCKFEIFHAISYRSQVVAGMNYALKIVVGRGDDYIHMNVYQPLACSGKSAELRDVQTGKKLFDEIK